MLDVEYSRQAQKFLQRADDVLVKRIFQKIEILQQSPIIPDTKVIEGFREKLFRVRVGNYRILYEIDYAVNKLGVVKIDKRERVYG